MSRHHTTRRGFLGTAGLLGASLLAQQAAFGADVPLAPPDKQPADLELPEVPPKTVGWAIVGLGELAVGEILPAFERCALSKPTALVSGHRDKAEKLAKAYGIKPQNIYNYDNYDKLAENPDVDVIYIVLPNSMHAEYTIRGFKAKKHVLCEKPMATSVEECEQMIAAANDAQKKLMIAYRLRYEPFNMAAIEMCQKQEFGKLQTITASNNQNVTAPNIRLSKQLGGGPLGDIGIYCLNATRYLTGQEPIEVNAMRHQPQDDPRFREVPESVAFTLKFPSGGIATCDCSFGTAESRRYRVQGADGVLHMDRAFGYRGQRLFLDKGGRDAELKIEPVNHFAAEMDHFSECVRADREPRTPGEEGLADVRVIAAIEEAAKSGRAVRVRG
ncbi:MAG TPA: Gfo/Idh/MocA family oxidoreductase [Pirellulales bacterium]